MSYADAATRHAFFVQFNFTSGPEYVWQGFRPLTIGGNTWKPVGPQATVDEVSDPVGDNVPGITFMVSGVDSATLAAALSSSDEIRGQLAFIYDLFFDDNWKPVGDFAVFAVARMDTIKISNQPANKDGSRDQVISISAENYLTNGPYAPNGRYSNADQWARQGNDNDLYFQYMAINQNRRQRWPNY